MKYFVSTVVFLLTLPGARGQSTLNIANGGVFTDTQMNLYLQSLINGLSPTTEFQGAQGAHVDTEALTGGIAVPNGSTVFQSSALAGYLTNSSSNTNGVGGYFQCSVLTNSTKCWGANVVSRDVASLTNGITLYGLENDVNPQNATSAYSNIIGYDAVLDTTQTGNYGAAFVANTNAAGLSWAQGFATQSGHVLVALSVGASCTSGTCSSQPINLNAFNASSSTTAGITATAPGGINLSPAPGQSVNVPLVKLTAGTFSSLPACAAATEGTQAAVTDSTTIVWGATITGGGANHVLAYCDGTHWTVSGK